MQEKPLPGSTSVPPTVPRKWLTARKVALLGMVAVAIAVGAYLIIAKRSPTLASGADSEDLFSYAFEGADTFLEVHQTEAFAKVFAARATPKDRENPFDKTLVQWMKRSKRLCLFRQTGEEGISFVFLTGSTYEVDDVRNTFPELPAVRLSKLGRAYIDYKGLFVGMPNDRVIVVSTLNRNSFLRCLDQKEGLSDIAKTYRANLDELPATIRELHILSDKRKRTNLETVSPQWRPVILCLERAQAFSTVVDFSGGEDKEFRLNLRCQDATDANTLAKILPELMPKSNPPSEDDLKRELPGRHRLFVLRKKEMVERLVRDWRKSVHFHAEGSRFTVTFRTNFETMEMLQRTVWPILFEGP